MGYKLIWGFRKMQDGCQDGCQNTKVDISCIVEQLRRCFWYIYKVWFQGQGIHFVGYKLIWGFWKIQDGCQDGHQNKTVSMSCSRAIRKMIWFYVFLKLVFVCMLF